MANNAKAKILRTGKDVLTDALLGMSVAGVHSFKIGNLPGFEPLELDTDPRGTITYEGSYHLIQVRRISEDTVRYSLTVPENVGPIDVGNIVLYMSDAFHNATPAIMVALPFVYVKVQADPNIGEIIPQPVPGNRFVVNITIKHSIDGPVDAAVEVVVPTFSSLAFFDKQSSVPPALVNPWSNFVIHNHTMTQSPALVTKRSDDQYWAMPLWQSLQSPKFGVIDGGAVGDGHLIQQQDFVWGQRYTTSDEEFKGQLGGGGYNDPVYDVIGGASYT